MKRIYVYKENTKEKAFRAVNYKGAMLCRGHNEKFTKEKVLDLYFPLNPNKAVIKKINESEVYKLWKNNK